MLDRRTLAISLLAALALPRAAAAERRLDLGGALALARVHNRDLRVARARLEQSATNIEQAWTALRPQVLIQGKYSIPMMDGAAWMRPENRS